MTRVEDIEPGPTTADRSDDLVARRRAGDVRSRILFVTDRLPGDDNGHAIRVANTLAGLSEHHEVEVLLIDISGQAVVPLQLEPFRLHVARAALSTRSARVLGVLGPRPSGTRYQDARRLRRSIRERLGGQHWDLIWCSRIRTHLVTRAIEGPRIVDFDDLGDRLLMSKISDRRDLHGAASAPANAWDLLDAVRWRRLQRIVTDEAARVVVCTESDRDHLGSQRVAVVPNGFPDPRVTSIGTGRVDRTTVDHARSERPPGDDRRPEIVFAGQLTYEPNLLAVEWFIGRVLPTIHAAMGDVRFTVVGDRRGTGWRLPDHPAVRYVGHVPQVDPYFRDADIAVTPLRSGGGSRLKVIEALARGVPLVSTTFAQDGFDLIDGEEALLADDPAAFAHACLTILREPDRGRRIADAARVRFAAEFQSASCSDAVARLADDVLAAAAVAARRTT